MNIVRPTLEILLAVNISIEAILTLEKFFTIIDFSPWKNQLLVDKTIDSLWNQGDSKESKGETHML